MALGLTKQKSIDIRSVIFSGHKVDLPDRAAQRLPPQLKPLIADAILTHVRPLAEFDILGLSSCARVGDILFHEARRRMNLPTRIVLPFSPDQFVETSVEGVKAAH